MFSSLPSLPAISTPPSAPPSGGPAAPEHGEESHAFARRLQEAQDQEDRGAAAKKPASASPASARHSSPAAGSKPRAEQAESVDSTAATAKLPAAPGGEAPADDTPAAAAESAEEATATDGAPQDLSALLAQLRSHAPATPQDPGRRAAGREGDDADALPEHAGHADQSGKASRAGATAVEPAGNRATSPSDPSTADLREVVNQAAGTPFKEQLAAAQAQPAAQDTTAPAQAPLPAALPDASTFSAALAAATSAQPAAPAPGSTAAAPAQAQLPAALNSPDFAPQLGLQISTFVRDGVQHAQLHLNPAEMGPVTVQIQLEGQTAQVHLLADQAPTRQALEQAMPQLAGSLREAGLTLTGGGVFQQPRQAGGESQDGGTASRGSRGRSGTAAIAALDGSGGTASVNQPTPRRRGVVDLVA